MKASFKTARMLPRQSEMFYPYFCVNTTEVWHNPKIHLIYVYVLEFKRKREKKKKKINKALRIFSSVAYGTFFWKRPKIICYVHRTQSLCIGIVENLLSLGGRISSRVNGENNSTCNPCNELTICL